MRQGAARPNLRGAEVGLDFGDATELGQQALRVGASHSRTLGDRPPLPAASVDAEASKHLGALGVAS